MKQNILVVDDDAAILEMMHEFLSSEGFTVMTARNGEEGLEKYGAHFDGLVIADLDMPVMGGIEFLERLKKRDPDCIGLIITGQGSMGTCIKSLREGLAYDYLLKPLDHMDLLLTSCRNAWQKKELEFQNRNLMDSLKKTNVELREALDSLIKAKDKLVESKRIEAMLELAVNVAHEVNNPLSVISVNTQMMMKIMNETDPQYESMRQIRKNIVRISEFVKSIQDIRTHKFKINPKTGDLKIIDKKTTTE
jgi:DNA-binding NtrC family response regulator|tara:strand:+ start:350 stop:1099 length:750 start_codon:yes stop_codon:yes gene_type:complete